MPSSSEIRQQFIDFFCRRHGHVFVPSSPVVPVGDPTLLFTNAGMNQFKPYFLGTETPPHPRVANTQKCIRAGGKHNDLDDVGKDTYHHTFFEMLGNWSFGDYFKKEAIAWAWELLTDVWELDKSRLHVTVFEGDPAHGIPRDDEAARFWKDVGVPDHQIHLGSKKDNFWEMGNTGPCGPCTEIHFDRTAAKTGSQLVNAGTDQVIEIWNLVFIQFNRNEDQSLTPLPAQHVDTGMGFERICAVLQGKHSNYDTDVFAPLFEAICSTTKAPPYTGRLDDLKDVAYRVIADHIRTLTFALTDGAAIGNVGRDYVLRRILRRAERYGVQVLGTREPFLHRLVPVVVASLANAFPELNRDPEKVREQIYEEEEGFLRLLPRGLKLFNQIAQQMRSEGRTIVSGPEAFKLHDTYGIVLEITEQMAAEQGFTVDAAGFEAEMEKAREKAREGGKKISIAAIQGHLPKTDDSPKYGVSPIEAKVLGWVTDNVVVTSGRLRPGDRAALILDRTTFYAEQGGQVGDQGALRAADGTEFLVEDTQRLGDTVLHIGALLEGELAVGDRLTTHQSTFRRIDIMRNHTATHLLNLALREVLGGDCDQRGSLVDEAKTRFDFSFDRPVTAEELRRIEDSVNRRIIRDLPVTAFELPLAKARELPGVRAVFGEKYPDPVRVVLIGSDSLEQVTADMSIEFCGGTHVPRTGVIGLFRIVSQEAVAKGIRRVTAITGRAAYEEVQRRDTVLEDLASRFQCKPEELPARVAAIQDQLQALQDEAKQASARQAADALSRLTAEATLIHSAKLAVGTLPPAPLDTVREQLDKIRKPLGSAVIVVGWADDGKVTLLATVSPDLVKKGLKAADIIKEIAGLVGGKGGGKPDFAQAGGKDPAKLPEALAKAKEMVRQLLER